MLPTGLNSPRSRKRNNPTCIGPGMSPISSRNRVPPSAAAMRPGLAVPAPVKAPFSWPKSSDSSRFSGIAPQLSDTIGFSRRSEWKWIACATRPLPVPDSPVSRIVLLVRATVSIILKTPSIASLRPMMFEKACDIPSVRFSRTFSWRSWRFSIFSRTFILSRSTSNGLLR